MSDTFSVFHSILIGYNYTFIGQGPKIIENKSELETLPKTSDLC